MLMPDLSLKPDTANHAEAQLGAPLLSGAVGGPAKIQKLTETSELSYMSRGLNLVFKVYSFDFRPPPIVFQAS